VWHAANEVDFLAVDYYGDSRRDFLSAAVVRHSESGDSEAGRDRCPSTGSERLISGRTRFAWFPVARVMTPQPTDNDNRCPSTSATRDAQNTDIEKPTVLQVTVLYTINLQNTGIDESQLSLTAHFIRIIT